MSYALHGGLCMGPGEATGQRLTAPPHAHRMDLNVRRGGSLLPFLLVLFSLVLPLNLYVGLEGRGGGRAGGLPGWVI